MCSPSWLLWSGVRADNDSYSARLVEQSQKSKAEMEQEEWDRLFFLEKTKAFKSNEKFCRKFKRMQISECPVQAEFFWA